MTIWLGDIVKLGGLLCLNAGVCVIIGLIVGRINDHIESAESLKWGWSRRWSLVGVLAMLGLGFLLSSRPISDHNDYTPLREAEAQQIIATVQTELADVNTRRSVLEFEWAAYRQLQSDFSSLEDLITEQAILEYALAWNAKGYPYSYADDVANAGCPANSADSDRYYYSSYPHDYSPPFRRYIYGADEVARYTEEVAKLQAQLPAEANTAQWVETRTNMLFCDWQAARLRGIMQYQHIHSTRTGINEQFVSALRLMLTLGSAFVVMGGVVGGLRKSETIDLRTRPNQGIRRTLQSAGRITVIFGLVGMVVGGLIGMVLVNLPEGDFVVAEAMIALVVPLSMVCGLSVGVALGLVMGGFDAVVKHILLRLFLQRSGSIPRNYAALLNEAASLILLRRVGGGYIYIHRYLLEYYAALEDHPDKDKSKV